MLVESPPDLLEFVPASKPKLSRKGSRQRYTRNTSKTPDKVSQPMSQTFDEHEREDLALDKEYKTEREKQALDNLLSLNDEPDNRGSELEKEIQRITANLPLEFLHRISKEMKPKAAINTPSFAEQTERSLYRTKTTQFRLPIVPLLKRALTSEDSFAVKPVPGASGTTESTENSSGDPIKIIQTNFTHTSHGTYNHQTTRQDSQEKHKDIIEKGNIKKSTKEKKKHSKYRAIGNKIRTQMIVKTNESHTKEEARYDSVTPPKKEENSLMIREEMFSHQVQRTTMIGSNTFRRYKVKGFLKDEKERFQENTENSCLTSGGLQKDVFDKDNVSRRTTFRKKYLDLSKEEQISESNEKIGSEDRVLQQPGIKVIEFGKWDINLLKMTNSRSHEDEYFRKTQLIKSKPEPKDIERLTEHSIGRSDRIEDIKEIYGKISRGHHSSHRRGNISMNGFNIFKFKTINKEPILKELDASSLISAPISSRFPVDGSNKQKGSHDRSKSSLLRTKIIPKDTPLLYVMGSEREAKYKDIRKQTENSSSIDLNKKTFSVGFFGPGSFQNENKNSVLSKLKAKLSESSTKIFLEGVQKRPMRYTEISPSEREEGIRPVFPEIIKEPRPTYSPIRPLKTLPLCSKS